MRLVRARARVSAFRLGAAALSAGLALSACHVPGTSAGSGSSGGGQTITVAVVPGLDPSIGNAPLYLANSPGGFFSQHDLHVNIKSYSSLQAVKTALQNGGAQIAAGDYTDFLYEQASKGLPLKLIADGYDAAPSTTEILTLPGSKITKPLDLVNKKVATPLPQLAPTDASRGDNRKINNPYGIETLMAESVLQSDGVSFTSVRWQPTRASEMISDLKTGKVSAILVSEPYVFQAESQLGAQVVVDAGSGVASGLPQSGYFASSSFASTNPAAVSAFRTALLQAQADAATRGPVQGVLTTAAHMTTAQIHANDAALVTLGTYPTALSVGQVQRVSQLMFEAGMTTSPVSIGAMVDG
ncbi:MAG TPA: ABC transporter substrate-binding protein [Streptosporangiaceae bacterium]|jgi:NitT/TauT family transport system substrate-binding protein